jgi:hypothetical protein
MNAREHLPQVKAWAVACMVTAGLISACGARSDLEAGPGASGGGGNGSGMGTTANTTSQTTGTGGAGGSAGASPCDGAPAMLHASESGAYYVTSDDTHVYWTNAFAGTVMRVPHCGGEVTVLAENETSPFAVAVDGTHVYWAGNTFGGVLTRAPIGGGAPEGLTAWDPGQPEGVRVDATHAYVTVVADLDGQALGIWRVPKDGSKAERIYAGNVLRAIALDDEHVYFGTETPDGSGSELMRLPKTGGAAFSLTPALVLGEIVVRDDHVYWTTWDSLAPTPGNVLRIAKDGGAVEVLWNGEPGVVAGLAVDDTHVYWTSQQDGAVRARPKSGGEVLTLSTGHGVTEDVETRGGWVFWVNFKDGSLWRAAKP